MPAAKDKKPEDKKTNEKEMRKIIVFILATTLVGCLRKMTPEKHYIPWGYTGKIEIFFDVTNGKSKEREGKFRVYRINNKGILKTQWTAQYGYSPAKNSLIMYIDDNGKTKHLADWGMDNIVLKSKDSIGVFSSYISDVNGKEFLYYYVGTKEDYFRQKNSKID